MNFFVNSMNFFVLKTWGFGKWNISSGIQNDDRRYVESGSILPYHLYSTH